MRRVYELESYFLESEKQSSEEENLWTLRDPVYRHGPVFISSLVHLFLYWLLRLHLFIYVYVCVYEYGLNQVRGKLMGVNFSSMRGQGSNTGHQVWQHVHLPIESSLHHVQFSYLQIG